MDDLVIKTDLKEKLIGLFEENRQEICRNDTPAISQARVKAIEIFGKLGFPTTKLEQWRNTDISKALSRDYEHCFQPSEIPAATVTSFQCEVPDFDTYLITLLNGWFLPNLKPLKKFPDGTLIGSLAQAMIEYPDIVEEYLTKERNYSRNGLDALNTAFSQDGIFIYVPDGVEVKDNIQMVDMINLEAQSFIQNRNLIILGKNSRLTLVHCDDSLNHQVSFTNTMTEVFLGENAVMDHYKLQNINDNSTFINSVYFHQDNGSRLSTNSIILNGGLIRNDIHVKIEGHNCESHIFGLYLVDKEQHIDNQIYVDHIKPGSISTQLFKGIIDDHSKAVFNGHIRVHRDAQKTSANQTNKNILLTDKATVNAKPFLEIYADDVKCSHGATVGQLDPNAMFYIRSRGLSEYNARMLLMYAFAAEVINKISISALRLTIDDLVKKRLRGELSVCDQCVLNCRNKENTISFNIDMSKI
ncbi:MAG: Fe-S cluster assembly protein SufD [Bacteroidetes bacterium]|nr:Fe-S cluster assembly protein SufD [Bacteroidota bacterium]